MPFKLVLRFAFVALAGSVPPESSPALKVAHDLRSRFQEPNNRT